MKQHDLTIGILASNEQQLDELENLVSGAGYQVAASVSLQDSLSKPFSEVDIWVVNLDMNSPLAQAVLDRLDGLEVPVIYEEDCLICSEDGDATERQHRERRLAKALRQLERKNASQDDKQLRRAKYVWVLGASTGGPEAVAEFLKGVPNDLPDVAFLYAQHIYHQALESLKRVVTNNSKWDIQNTDQARMIREKTVYLVSPGYQIELNESGVVSPLAQPWGGDFQPSIDHVIAKVARVYKKRGGAIIFSGMGVDGANSCKMLHYRGGQVWAQCAQSSTIDSMPVSVSKTGCVQFSGTPTALAKKLVSFQQSRND